MPTLHNEKHLLLDYVWLGGFRKKGKYKERKRFFSAIWLKGGKKRRKWHGMMLFSLRLTFMCPPKSDGNGWK